MAFTFFFRDLYTLEIAVNKLVPIISGRSRIKIWDAGCANGPEPYTLAILLAEHMGKFAFKNVQITASDIDESQNFGTIIHDGIYSDEELKRIPPEIFAKYFSPLQERPGYFIIDELIREKVRYIKSDLLSYQPAETNCSFILCKNVLLHFQYPERVEVLKMFHKSLADGGLLAMEQTQKMPDELQHMFNRVVPDAQLYEKIGGN
ncbi:MAG: chemotaxis protein CheR [Ignavibacteria bacterium]|nr:chemotaxis protein CheR [Ignavibacteria bacterium]